MDESIRLLEGLLKAYSPSHEEAGAVAYLVEEMRRLGFQAQADEIGNAVGVLGDGPREILLLGHIDTVPGYIEPRFEGDRLYGRGSVDAKGPLACFTQAAALAGAAPGWRLVVIGAVGEEAESHGAKHLVSRTPPEALIIGEPSGWDRVTLGYKGSAWYIYSIERTLAHSAANVQTACELAVGFWNRVNTFTSQQNEGRTKAFEQLTPSLRGFSSTSDGFVEKATLKVNFRLPPGMDPADLAAQLHGMAEGGVLEEMDRIRAHRAEKNTPLVRAMLAGIRKEGGTPGFTVKTGTSDMNIVAPIWKCQTLAYGPGDSNLDHTPEEHVLVPEYQRAVLVLAEALRLLMS